MKRLRPWRGLMAVAILVAPAGGCLFGGSDECNGGEATCDGNALNVCQPAQCMEPGCAGRKWKSFACDSETCIQPAGHEAQCAASPVIDPLCQDAPYCLNGHAVTCIGNYAIGPGQDCGTNGCSGAYCRPAPDPECNGETGPVCIGNRRVECSAGSIVSAAVCACSAGAGCCDQGECLTDGGLSNGAAGSP